MVINPIVEELYKDIKISLALIIIRYLWFHHGFGSIIGVKIKESIKIYLTCFSSVIFV